MRRRRRKPAASPSGCPVSAVPARVPMTASERLEKLMSIEIRVPALPESIADATLVAWHKQPGEAFKRDENLADLETDKVVLEVPAPADGVMGDQKFPVGATVTEGQVLAVISEGGAPAAPSPAKATAPAAAAAAAPAPATVAAKVAAPAEAAKLSP